MAVGSIFKIDINNGIIGNQQFNNLKTGPNHTLQL